MSERKSASETSDLIASTSIMIEGITSPNQEDVLFGRGAPLIKFPGNVRYRQLVASCREEYRSSTKKHLKQDIVHQIYSKVRSEGGRFLQKNGQGEENDWVEVEERRVKGKISQSLREGSNIRRHKLENQELSTASSESGDDESVKGKSKPGPPSHVKDIFQVQQDSWESRQEQQASPVKRPRSVSPSSSGSDLEETVQKMDTISVPTLWDVLLRTQSTFNPGLDFSSAGQPLKTREIRPSLPPRKRVVSREDAVDIAKAADTLDTAVTLVALAGPSKPRNLSNLRMLSNYF